MKIIKNNWWYSIIFILLIIWFLLFLWVWIFSLILNDLKDNRAMWDYYKAYAWAESASELALLKIKENWYAYYDKVDHNVNNRSILLANNPLNTWDFNWNKDVFISYDIWSKVNEYNWTLRPLEYDIVPLFYINDSWEQKISNLIFSITSWTEKDLAWNIIWKDSWLSWVWANTLWTKKTLNNNNEFNLISENINDFITSSDSNYFVLFNSWNSWDIKYSIKSSDSLKYFSKPKTSIISSAQVWNYKQNLNVDLNNTEFLNILKYSIFSN
jgi:hypothetical protein